MAHPFIPSKLQKSAENIFKSNEQKAALGPNRRKFSVTVAIVCCRPVSFVERCSYIGGGTWRRKYPSVELRIRCSSLRKGLKKYQMKVAQRYVLVTLFNTVFNEYYSLNSINSENSAKPLYTAYTVACMPIYIVREG